MKRILPSIALVLGTVMLQSCEDTTSQAGSSLVEDEVKIIEDDAFTASGESEPNRAVRSRTILQLLGRISATGYGDFSSDIVCQYMPATSVDTTNTNVSMIDSVKLLLTMYKGGFVGDSVVPMGVAVYPLNRQLPTELYSDFDPSGYYDPTPIGTATYSAMLEDSPYAGTDSEGSQYKHIAVDLPKQFGIDLYNLYQDSPQTVATPQNFAKWFPGLYITTSFGQGRVTRISSNSIQVYYHKIVQVEKDGVTKDSLINYVGSYLGVTPEVYTNNNITYNMSQSLSGLVENGKSIIVGPLGYDVEFKFPAGEILRRYQEQAGELAIVNSLTFSVPATEIENDYGITPPPYVLMVKKSEKNKFFSAMNINDNMSSFYAAYDSTNKVYNFSSMRSYINDLINKGEVTAEDEEFVICPVNVSFYTNSSSSSYYYYYGYSTSSTTVSSITPYVTEPVMVQLDFDKAEIDFSFTKQSL